MTEAREIILAVRQEFEQAVEAILTAASEALEDVAAVRDGNSAALEQAERKLLTILEACAFQDLTGQRLSKLEAALNPQSVKPDSLLNGPALVGEGLDQAAADRILSNP